MQQINSIGVIGSGTMGNGIAHISALNGYAVFLVDINDNLLKSARTTISNNLEKQVSKKKITLEEKNKALNAIMTTSSIEDIASVDLVVEAVSENQQIKEDIFSKLDGICKKSTIFASNTSSISITKLALKTNRSSQVIGMHFMNPVPIMKLVEVIPR